MRQRQQGAEMRDNVDSDQEHGEHGSKAQD